VLSRPSADFQDAGSNRPAVDRIGVMPYLRKILKGKFGIV
jgi:hypothetical protein